jgi:hypothetical protein
LYSYNSWLNAAILLFAIKNPIKKIYINIWTQKKKEEKKKIIKKFFLLRNWTLPGLDPGSFYATVTHRATALLGHLG